MSSTLPVSQPRIPEAGDIVAAKYRVVRKIAEGGMGVVVEAMHLQLEERVAIKFLRPDALGNPVGVDVTARFLREARAALKIRSEHVVRVYDASILENEVPYIVMELLEGQDLEQILEQHGAFAIADVVDYVVQASEGLAEAHSLGIIHRDLKPANLFLSRSASGVPMIKVLDFGISKDDTLAGAALSLTSAQAVLGSPIYMSPEQMRSTKDVDARSDIWALGVILYELLTGRPPFGGETMPQVCSSIIEDTPIPPSRLRSQIPTAVEKAVLKCLEKRPEDRFTDVAELAEALAPFGTEIGAEAAARTARAMKRSTRNSLGPRQPSPSLAALATTNKGDDNPTQTLPQWPALGTSSKQRRVLMGVGWAFGLTLLSAGVFVAARKASAPRAAGGPTHVTSAVATPPPPEGDSTKLTPPVAATPDPAVVASPADATAPKPSASDKPAASDKPNAARAVAVTPPPKPRPTKPPASTSGPPQAASPAPDPSKPVTWDERK